MASPSSSSKRRKNREKQEKQEREMLREAFGIADITTIATPVFLACGYALKEALTTKPDGTPGELYEQAMKDDGGFPLFDELGNSILNEWADEMARNMIWRAVELFGDIAEQGLENDEEIRAFLNHEQQPTKK